MPSISAFFVLACCTLLLLIITLAPLSKGTHWIIRGLDFPRLQFTLIAVILLVFELLLLDLQETASILLIFSTAICLIWQLSWIIPYTFFYPVQVAQSKENDADKQLSIITANVLTPNRNAKALIELVLECKPDILVTLESDQWWQEQLAVLEKTMPYTIKCPLDNLYGMHLYSKLPLTDHEICYLVEADVPSIHTSIELRTGDKIRAHFLHPAPPSPTENEKSAQRDAELIIVAKSIAKTKLAVIVTGDLNDVAWSATTRLFLKISGLLDPRIGRGIFSTFHADHLLIRWPLDHLFHSKHFTLQKLQRLPSIGSDHFPLLTRLTFSPQLYPRQEAIEASPAEHEWAREITEQQRVTVKDVPQPGED